jgi:hypothetical protein
MPRIIGGQFEGSEIKISGRIPSIMSVGSEFLAPMFVGPLDDQSSETIRTMSPGCVKNDHLL